MNSKQKIIDNLEDYILNFNTTLSKRQIIRKVISDMYDKFSLKKSENVVLDGVSNRFRFTYHSCDKELFVELEAENLNKAMIEFATYYHQIDEVYEIEKL